MYYMDVQLKVKEAILTKDCANKDRSITKINMMCIHFYV